MRFAFVEEHRSHVPIDRLCQILNVTSRGYRAWRSRPVSQRQRDDLVLLAHIREQHRLSLGSYGRPRITEELKGGRAERWPSSCGPFDAPERLHSGQNPQIQGNNRQQSPLQHRAQFAGP